MYIVTHVVGLEIAHVSHTLKYCSSNVFFIKECFLRLVKLLRLLYQFYIYCESFGFICKVMHWE